MSEFKFNDAALANLKGKVAIVTGGASGIGKGTVEYLSKHGAKVVAFDVNPYPESLPPQVTYQKCNVTIWSDIVKGFEETKKLHGRIDIVVANAGLNDKENLLKDDLEEPDWKVLNVNLKGTMMTVKAASYFFRHNEPQGGVVIMTGSITSYVPAHKGVFVYSATKYAILGMLRNMSKYFPRFNSRINMVAPYLTNTGMAKEKDNKTVDWRKGQPTNEPIAIAKAIAALSADESNNGKGVICCGDNYYETEGTFDRVLPEIASNQVVDKWNEVLQFNPFPHMANEQ